MNDIVSDLIVDGEQQSDISKFVHLSPSDSILKEGYTRINLWPCFECNKQWEIPLTSFGNDRNKFTRKDNVSWRRFTLEYLVFSPCLPMFLQ